jgi:hypothetical protein
VSRRKILVAAIVLALPSAAVAQISPGPLARGHASLEGSHNCLKCHASGKACPPEKCLGCHKPLAERIAAGKGLHAREDYKDCKTCHIEHQGVDAPLAWWGKAGREAFDHRLTTYALEGKHTTVACQKCHEPRFKGYLGLSTTCAACHRDAHRGQFGARDCASCHTQTAWKPAPGFDHGKTSYPLLGKHGPVACEKCHALAADLASPGASYRKYAGAPRECLGCHADVHKGRLGTACAQCHTTETWRRSPEGARFDHERTRYPLRGRHVPVACEKCHLPGRALRVAFERCTDCHQDTHQGQLAKRVDQGRCEACHDVTGFAPSRFGMAEHQKSAYPLKGAHLAVACDACHRPLAAEAGRRPTGATKQPVRYRFASTRCLECHKDPHRGELDKRAGSQGCEACHGVESWRKVAFDHAVTKFPLAGGHAKPACAACHRSDKGKPLDGPRWVGVTLACEGCHRDPHNGQLNRATDASPCQRCHTIENWKPTQFDHARETSYALDSAHIRVACAGCHPKETRDGVTRVRYKPVPKTCKGCHTGPAVKEGQP